MNGIKKILALAMIPLMSISLTSCSFYIAYADADKYLIGSQDYEGELKDLDIDWVSGSVTLVEDANATKISVVEENDLKDEEKVHSYFHDGILNVKYWASGYRNFSFRTPIKNLVITYPSLENIKVGITSGVFVSESLEAKSATFKLTSGKMKIGKIKADNFKASMTSGTLTVDELDVKEGDFGCTSGTILIKKSQADKLSFGLTSGKIDLAIPENGATIDFHKTSGSYHSEGKEYTIDDKKYVYGDGSCQIQIKITSGAVYIR